LDFCRIGDVYHKSGSVFSKQTVHMCFQVISDIAHDIPDGTGFCSF
jgi:hypothetical protein